MLIRFCTSNFLSFDEQIQLSMVRGRSRKHNDHIVKDPAWNGVDLLRLALVFGANASGKSNLVKAISFAQELITEGTKPNQRIPVVCHKLRKSCSKAPSHFEFEFKHNNNYYLYGFELDTDIIRTEWLYKTGAKTQKLLYERKTTKSGRVFVDFGAVNYDDKRDEDFLKFVAKGTRPNQLFLTESIERNVKQFKDVYSWFGDVLRVVFPESEYSIRGMLPGANNDMRSSVVDYLRQFDSGISDIAFKPATFEIDLADAPDELKQTIQMGLKPGDSMTIQTPRQQRFIVRMDKDKNITMFRMMTKHRMQDTKAEIEFDLGFESDGTLRMLDLIPALVIMSATDAVFVFDELDRSLHPNLSKRIIEQFLALHPERNSQIIATTHETYLLDLNILRRDEIWFTEKDKKRATRLYSLEEFAPRYDKDIQKGYLVGRFGSIPFLGRMKHLNTAK